MKFRDFPPDLMREQSLEAVLKMLEFAPANLGVTRKYGNLEFGVCESIGCSFLSCNGLVTSRTWTLPQEVRIFSPITPIELMATIYRLWAEVYPDQEVSDADLHFGKEWIAYQREVKRPIPPPPTMWADREYLRFCLTYIVRQHDWIDEDYEIRFSRVPGQLRMVAKDLEVFCPARGDWLGEVIVSAKALFRGIPMRFMGSFVALEAYGDKLGIAGHRIDSRWDDQPRVAMEEYQ